MIPWNFLRGMAFALDENFMKLVRTARGGVVAAWRFCVASSRAGRQRLQARASSKSDGGDGVHRAEGSIDVRRRADSGDGRRACGTGGEGDRRCLRAATAECASGFCVDGVCCNSACTEGCKTCSAPERARELRAASRASNAARRRATCAAAPAATCGLDGTCDGDGACRKYPAAPMCKPGTCDGAAVVGVYVCDGDGRCKPGPRRSARRTTAIAATGACVGDVHVQQPVRQRHQCVERKLRQAASGAVCSEDERVRVGLLHRRGLLQRRLPRRRASAATRSGRDGTCWPVDADKPDPARRLPRQGAADLRTDRALRRPRRLLAVRARDGVHRRRRAAATASTPPAPATASAPARRRACRTATRTAARTARASTRCASDADCVAGHRLRERKLRPQAGRAAVRGRRRVRAGTTASTASAATRRAAGACRSCALPSSLGPLHAGRRRHRRSARACARRRPQSTCGTDGKCDGAAAARSWPVGTAVRARELRGATSTRRPATCSASGQCVAPDALPVRPFACNGARCFIACTADDQCVPPDTCADNSCGLKENGALCSAGARVPEQVLRAGRLLRHRLPGACKSCARRHDGRLLERRHRARRSERRCARRGSPELRHATAGARRAPASATRRARPACPRPARRTTNLFTPLSTCDGAGTCVTPGGDLLLPVPLRRRRLQGDLHGRRGLRAAGRVHGRLVRPQAARRGLRRARTNA